MPWVTQRVPPPSPGKLELSPGNRALDQRLRAAMEAERAASLDRRCPPSSGRASLRYRLDGREVVSLCSNDYLGLADERPLGSEPSGAAASRLVCGDLEVHREVEHRFAALLGFEDAVLFPSGFQANVGVPAALLRAGDVAHSDALNHASLIDGLRLTAARRELLEHLRAPSGGGGGGAKTESWWFVESVFSMDGDGPALADLDAHLANGGCVYLDEAHAVGLHVGGRGRAAMLEHRPTVLVAPLGKAFGCAGAFVCASASVCEWIRGHARAFVFTTGVSPALVDRIGHAIDRVAGPEGDRRRELLWRNVEVLRAALGQPESEIPSCFGHSPPLAVPVGHGHSPPLAVPVGHGHSPPLAVLSPIFPVLVGDNRRALAISAALLERGWHVQAIRPPTVPEHGARLRVTVSADHDLDTLERFAADLKTALREIA
jgi:8-amino-7-oxononanoate synthase